MKRKEERKEQVIVPRWFAVALAISAMILASVIYQSLSPELPAMATAVAVLSWLAWYMGVQNGR